MAKEIDSDLVKLRLQQIADRNAGRITPSEVVEDARDPESPLHAAFQWDDTAAAIAHRLSQARSLIRSVRITVQRSEVAFKAPLYVRDPELSPRTAGYVDVKRLRADGDLSRESVVREFSAATAALRRARAVAAVLGVEDEVDGFIAGIDTLARRVGEPAQPATVN